MDQTAINSSIIVTLIALYLLAIGGMVLKRTLSARILGLYLALYPILLVNLLSIQMTEIQMAIVILSAPLFLSYVQAFFTEKTKAFDWVRYPLVLISLAIIVLADSQALKISSILFYLIIYAIKIRKQIATEVRTRGMSLFSNPGPRVGWFRNFYILQTFLIGLLVLHLYTPLFVGLPVVFFLIAANIVLIYIQIFRESSFFLPLPKGQKYSKSTLTQEQKFHILNALEQLMNTEKLYVDPDVSLPELARKLHTSSHNLSQVLNEQKDQSFAEYIMQHRIDEAKRILREDYQKQVKIEDIALQVGYNSKSAFNTAFKRFTNLTPSEFRKLRNVRDYREERLAGRTIHHYGKAAGKFDVYLNHIDMVRNFLLIFKRNLVRNKVFSAINLLGLVLAFSSSLLIYLFIYDELSYDRSIDQAEDIYRIAWFDISPQTRTPHPMAQATVRDFPEVEAAVTITPWYGAGLSKQEIAVKNPLNNTQFEEPDFFFVDSTFFDVFDFELLSGNPETALTQPGGILLTPEMAVKYFGNEDPLGKRLLIGSDELAAEVVGIVKGAPKTTHFHFNFLISYVTLKGMLPPDHFWMTWGDFGHFNYIKLRKGTEPESLEAKIPEWFLKYNDWNESLSTSLLNGTNKFALQRITDIHLHSHLRWELENNGNILYIYILSAAVIFIIAIASINYINLTTAKSFERAKEIGIRKTLGALRNQLSLQFLTESVLFCLMAAIISMLLTWTVLPYFNELSDKSFSGIILLDPFLLFTGFMGILVIGLISGLYPSIALSSFKPTEIIRGGFARSKKGSSVNRALVITQFIISAILISASLVILKQINFMKEKPLGFQEEYLMTIPMKSNEMRERHSVVTNEIQRLSGVVNATAVSNVPGGQFNQNAIWTEGNPEDPVTISEMTFDYNTVQTLAFELSEGRNFEESFALDSAGGSFLLNETAAKQLRLERPLGEKIIWDLEEGPREGIVVGVIKDFHYKSLHQSIQPMIIDMRRSLPGYIIVRVKSDDIPSTTEALENTYKSFDTRYDFEYTFLDQSIDKLYKAEVRTLNIFSIFAVIALFLACLGLLGIAISMMNQKIKEVGIRKIHGATTAQILWMINWRFTKLILLALVVGLPLAYLLMTDWVAEFPYQVDMGILPFLLSVVILGGVALITTSLVVIKVATTNPAEALRHE